MRLTTSPEDGDARGRRLPCGCHAGDLADALDLSIDELLRAFEAGEVVTVPFPPPPGFPAAEARCRRPPRPGQS